MSAIRAVRAVFDDPEWKHNVLLGLVLMIIPMVGPIALSGWMCEAQQRMAHHQPNPIPRIDFADFGDHIKRGLSVFLVGLVITIPLVFLVYGFGAGAGFAAVAAGSATDEPIVALVIGLVAAIVALVLMLVASVFINAAQTRAELTENFGEALALGKLMAYAKATFVQVMIKSLAFSFVALGIVLVGLMLCYFGIYPAVVVLQIAAMHLRHQIYADYLARGGEPIPMKPLQMLQSEARAQGWTGY